ncbi:MAG: hypothetical protein WA637_10140 [Terriglobales bacterium]
MFGRQRYVPGCFVGGKPIIVGCTSQRKQSCIAVVAAPVDAAR